MFRQALIVSYRNITRIERLNASSRRCFASSPWMLVFTTLPFHGEMRELYFLSLCNKQLRARFHLTLIPEHWIYVLYKYFTRVGFGHDLRARNTRTRRRWLYVRNIYTLKWRAFFSSWSINIANCSLPDQSMRKFILLSRYDDLCSVHRF